jgi:membrane-associated phospholipid phosphatase
MILRRFRIMSRRRRHGTYAILLAIGLVVVGAWLPDSVRATLLRQMREHWAAASMLIAFIVLALSLLWSAGNKLDVWVFMNFNMWGARPRWLDWVMLGLTQLGSGVVAFVMAAIEYYIGARRYAAVLALGTISLWLIVELLKAIIRRQRPYELEGMRMVGSRMPGRSFPSGHTSQAFFLAVIISSGFLMPVWASLLLYILAGLVAITRMYVGAHYPRDILAGAILGSLWGLLARLLIT